MARGSRSIPHTKQKPPKSGGHSHADGAFCAPVRPCACAPVRPCAYFVSRTSAIPRSPTFCRLSADTLSMVSSGV